MADSPLAHSPTLSAAPIGAAGEAPARLPPETQVGEYVIDRFLGAGAMGEVYAGHHPVIGKKVAIKLLRRELAASVEASERFIREARAVNQIDHPNVIDVFAFGRLEDGRLYLVMDLVAGRSLRAVLADGATSIARALAILEPIADALDAAHARGVVHRDLKPDNIMRSPDGRVFVLDFGIAKLVSTANDGTLGDGTLTGQGTWLGTPAYMAPEQWSNDGAGPASDRYALGVIAFELLAGSPPYAASSVPAMMEQHFRADVPSLAARGLATSAIDEVLVRALAKDPEARFPSARELVAALRIASGTELGARTIAAYSGVRRPWVPAIVGTGVLGIVIAGMIIVRDDATDERHPAAAAAPAPAPAGTIAIDLRSVPDHALVSVGDHVVGATPTTIHVETNTQVTLTVRKPGYLPDRRTLTSGASDDVLAVTLGEVTRFQGVWRLPDGELRAFKRKADQVEVFKLDEVAGTRRFYKHYAFVDADAGIAFAADDDLVGPAPDDPSCHVPIRIEYRYEPIADTLELRRPKIVFEMVGGHCVPQSRDLESATLARADGSHDTVEVVAPAGSPKLLPSPFGQKSSKPARKPVPPPIKALPSKSKVVGKKAMSPYTKNAASNDDEDLPQNNQNAQILAPPQATVPIQSAQPQQVMQK